jgi:hypothetical protein
MHSAIQFLEIEKKLPDRPQGTVSDRTGIEELDIEIGMIAESCYGTIIGDKGQVVYQ